MGDKRTTVRMSTAKEAGDQILKLRIRELVADNKALRRRVLELQRKEMALKDRIIRSIRQEFEQCTPASPERVDKGTQTGASPASGSVESAPGPQPATRPTPGASGLGE